MCFLCVAQGCGLSPAVIQGPRHLLSVPLPSSRLVVHRHHQSILVQIGKGKEGQTQEIYMGPGWELCLPVIPHWTELSHMATSPVRRGWVCLEMPPCARRKGKCRHCELCWSLLTHAAPERTASVAKLEKNLLLKEYIAHNKIITVSSTLP